MFCPTAFDKEVAGVTFRPYCLLLDVSSRGASSRCYGRRRHQHVHYSRDCLVPCLMGEGMHDKRMASYGDATVATAGLLGKLGLPKIAQGYWKEHSQRSGYLQVWLFGYSPLHIRKFWAVEI